VYSHNVKEIEMKMIIIYDGEVLHEEEPRIWCPNCGTHYSVPKEQYYCSYCGTELDEC